MCFGSSSHLRCTILGEEEKEGLCSRPVLVAWSMQLTVRGNGKTQPTTTTKHVPKETKSCSLFVHVVEDLNVVTAHHPQLGPWSHGNQCRVVQVLDPIEPILQNDLRLPSDSRTVQFNPDDRMVVGICNDQSAKAVMADALRQEASVLLIFFIGVADAYLFFFKIAIQNDD